MPRTILHVLVVLLVATTLGCGGRRRSSMSRDGGMVACREQDEAPVSSDGSFTYRGRTVGGFDEGSCGGRGADFALRYEAPVSGTLLLSTQSPFTEFDTVLYVRVECEEEATELACDDDGGGGTRSMLDVEVEAGDVIYIFVDGWSDDDGGEFEVTGTILMDDGGVDGGFDGGFDGGRDAGFDGGMDAGSDGGFDAGFDGGMDAGFDGGFDGGMDAGSDGGFDAGFDGGMDAGFDGGFDAGFDGGTDAGGCPAGFEDCNGLSSDGCEADLSDPATCGSCTNVCTPPASSSATCASGTCGYVCDSGFGDCNGLASDGCEVDLTSTPSACGACTNSCPTPAMSTATCSSSTCGYSCDSGFADCNGLSSDGCEVDLTTPDGCGSCSNVCPARANATRTCTGGSTCGFTCNTNFGDCNGLSSDGCEADFMNDRNNCGGCRIGCPGMQMCCSGTCRSSC